MVLNSDVILWRTVMLSKCCLPRGRTAFLWFQIFFALSLLSGKQCTIPEASQEGLLHSFKSYTDVATFHYSVPREVLRATWQFAAFMDGPSCPQRMVHIYLKWGSYPVISVNNATFPNNMYPQQDYVIKVDTITSFEPKNTTIVPVYGPEPGDWFVGAYLSPWDEKVQQQGLGHKCHYSIGSVGIWMQTSSIESIPLGYQKTLKTKETTSYYKIYIPSGTWQFSLHIWACNFTIPTTHNINIPCIKSLALNGRVLPVYNNTYKNEAENLTVLDAYTFTETSPYEDSYYYLLVVSDSVIQFNVEVRIVECPIKITEKPFMQQYLDTPLLTKTLAQLRIKDIRKYHFHYSLNSDLTSPYTTVETYINQFQADNNFDTGKTCVPRYQLARIRHSKSFSGAYLLQGREWLTSWVMLTDTYPVITQFSVLPLVDIGGTLDISVHLEMDKLLTKQLVVVTVCIRRGRVPEIENGLIICRDQNLLMNLSSFDKYDGNLLIPFPQPDTWHIALHSQCYLNGIRVPCEMEEVLVSLDVRARQCVFPGSHPCGSHGVCKEIHRDLLYYTACNCFEGYKGWGCTDATGAKPKASLVMTTLMLTLSNGFFIPAIYLAMKRGLYAESLVYSATMSFSSLYHACDQHVMTYCITKYEVLQYCDFFSSILAFWVTLVAMAKLPTHYVSLCHMFGVFLIAFGVESDRTSLTSILLPLAIGVIIPVGTYMHKSFLSRKWKKPRNMWKLAIGLILAICGLLLFSLVETEANYYYVHSAWHMIIAISLVFLLPSSRRKTKNPSAPDSFSDDSELLDYKDFPSSPIFTVIPNQERSINLTLNLLRRFSTMSRKVFIGPLIHTNVKGELIIVDRSVISITDGKIQSVLENPNPEDVAIDDNTVVLTDGQFIIPGFIDCHTHAVQLPNLGVGYDKGLLDWLEKYTFPLEKQYADEKFAERIFDAVVKRTLAMGTTTACYFASLYAKSSVILGRKAAEYGQRAFIGKVNMNFHRDDGYYEGLEDSLTATKEFVEDITDIRNPLVRPIITPRFALSCDMRLLKGLGKLAKEKDLHIQSHISETLSEIQAVNDIFNDSYAGVYDRAGLLTNKTVMAHAVHLTDQEIDVLNERGTAVVHCPSSNTCLKSGFCDVRQLKEKGLKVGLGTDVGAGQSVSMLNAMQAALQVSSLLAVLKKNYHALDYKDVLHMATLAGAIALAIDDTVGNIVPGKQFDALVIDVNADNGILDDLRSYTLEESLQRFIYSGDDRNIVEVYVNGRKVK